MTPYPRADFAGPSRLMDAIRGGPHGTDRERAVAAAIEGLWPGTGEQLRAACLFHERSALRAVNGIVGGAQWRPARTVIFTPAGFPPSGWEGARMPHVLAAEAVPEARYLYATADRVLALVWHGDLAPRGLRPRAVACRSRAGDPRQTAGMARAAGLEEPWSVQLQTCAHWWPPKVGRRTVAAWAEVLPHGSSLVLTVPTPGGRPAGGEMGAMIASVSRVEPHPHTAEDVAGWIEGAGLVLAPAGVADVRALAAPSPAGEDPGEDLAGRVVGAVGLKR